ncbi:MAG: hypothetical protein ACR2N3_13505 [Pyrinomonadaceae bacterium]
MIHKLTFDYFTANRRKRLPLIINYRQARAGKKWNGENRLKYHRILYVKRTPKYLQTRKF